jgi:hypothetical protein
MDRWPVQRLLALSEVADSCCIHDGVLGTGPRAEMPSAAVDLQVLLSVEISTQTAMRRIESFMPVSLWNKGVRHPNENGPVRFRRIIQLFFWRLLLPRLSADH